MAKKQLFDEVAGKVAVITGATRGLGQGTAETLAEHGVHVVLADISPDVEKTFQAIAQAHPGNEGYAQRVDVADEGAVRGLVEGAVRKFGRLDIMVNNAGMHLHEGMVADMMAPYNVTVNALCPRLAATEMHWSFMRAESASRGITFEALQEEELRTIPLGRYALGRDMAGTILWLASAGGSYVTGQLLNLNGGLYFA